jgi:hypothetical protein
MRLAASQTGPSTGPFGERLRDLARDNAIVEPGENGEDTHVKILKPSATIPYRLWYSRRARLVAQLYGWKET